MSKHTPGPWEISEQYIIARSNRGLRTICQWRSYSDEPAARLIAAAPDLLDLVHDVAGLDQRSFLAASEDQLRYIINGWQEAARAAIAKAEGAS